MNCSIFDRSPAISKTKCAGEEFERLGVELLGDRLRLGVLLAFAGNLDHGELALERIAHHRQVGDAMDRHQLFQLMLDLLDHHRRA